MFYQPISLVQHSWFRMLLIGLVVFVGIIAALVSMHRLGQTHAAGGFATSFKETVGNDTYVFTNVSPASGTAANANFGTWHVIDQTRNSNNTIGISDLGTIGEKASVISSGGHITGSTSFTGTGTFSVINGRSSTHTTFPAEANPASNPTYAQEASQGWKQLDSEAEDVMGNRDITMCPPNNPNGACTVFGITPGKVITLNTTLTEGPAMKGWFKDNYDETQGYNTLAGLAVTPSAPIQLLAKHSGGGPLATLGVQKPAVVPVAAVAVFVLGIAISAAGVVVANFCGKADGCLGLSKNVWAVIGGLIGVVGAAISGGAGFLMPSTATAAAAAVGAGEIALGAAEGAAVEAVGSGLSAASLASIESADSFLSAASSFSAA